MVKIIIADDHQIFSEGLAEILSQVEAYDVLGTARNGNHLISMVQECKPDVVLLDISMPERNGFETAQYLKQHHPDIKIIMLTMHNSYEHAAPLLETGVNGYVLKNAGKQELQHAIAAVMDGKNYFSSDVMSTLTRGKEENPDVVNLSARELEILELVAQGFSTAEIGEKLFISNRTVETHRRNIHNKTDTKNSIQLINYAIKHRLIKKLDENT